MIKINVEKRGQQRRRWNDINKNDLQLKETHWIGSNDVNYN